ncbi:MAG: hypothetical protein WDZ49_03080 [Litorilinea sp.]
MWGELTVIDMDGWVYVAPLADPDDWVARFEKAHAFPAYKWAERMAALHNSELRAGAARRTNLAPAARHAPFDPRSTTIDAGSQ